MVNRKFLSKSPIEPMTIPWRISIGLSEKIVLWGKV